MTYFSKSGWFKRENIKRIPEIELSEGYGVRPAMELKKGKLCKKDKEAWRRLHRIGKTETGRNIKEFFHYVKVPDKSDGVFFAEFNGEIVGCVSVATISKEEFKLYPKNPIYYEESKISAFHHAVVAEEHRQKGLYKAMMGLCLKYFLEKKFKWLYIAPSDILINYWKQIFEKENVLVMGDSKSIDKLCNAIKKSEAYEIYSYDNYNDAIQNMSTIPESIDILHIYLSYINMASFSAMMIGCISLFTPKLVVINSIVYPDTTRAIERRLTHYKLNPHIAHCNGESIKYIGGIDEESALLTQDYFNKIGYKTEILNSPESTELAGFFPIIYTAMRDAFNKEVSNLSKLFGVTNASFDWKFVDKEYLPMLKILTSRIKTPLLELIVGEEKDEEKVEER